MTEFGLTPSQTVGPYLTIGLLWDDGGDIVSPDFAEAIVIEGTLYDGGGDPVPDGMIEVWQADPDGNFNHPDDPRGAVRYPGFRGFGRSCTDAAGRFSFRTVKPGYLPAEEGATEAPHLDISVFARGLLNRVITRLYFPDEFEANANDPVLSTLAPSDAARLVAEQHSDGSLRFDIRLQGTDETPFFQL